MAGLEQQSTVEDALVQHFKASGDKKFKENIVALEEGVKLCVVCGNGSHRTDWKNVSKDGKFVACDNHTAQEFNAAIKAAVEADASEVTDAK